MNEPRPRATCEYRHTAGDPACGHKSKFRVKRGREHDAQDSCRQHLAATVVALAGEERREVTVQALAGA